MSAWTGVFSGIFLGLTVVLSVHLIRLSGRFEKPPGPRMMRRLQRRMAFAVDAWLVCLGMVLASLGDWPGAVVVGGLGLVWLATQWMAGKYDQALTR